MDRMIWIILAILVLLVIIGVVMSRSRKQREASQRAEAAELRTQAAEHDREVREREAEADAVDAQARKARADADEQAANAKRLEVEAERREEHRAEAQEVRDGQLRRADALDPDVRTDRQGRRLDDDQKVRRLDDDEELDDPYGGRGERAHSEPPDDHPGSHSKETVPATIGDDAAHEQDRRDGKSAQDDPSVREHVGDQQPVNNGRADAASGDDEVPDRPPHHDRHGDEAGAPDVPREVGQASPTAADRAFAGRTERLDDGDPAPESGNRTDFRDAPVAGDDRPHTSAADRRHLRREDGLDSQPGQP